jgi:hypothetical protein
LAAAKRILIIVAAATSTPIILSREISNDDRIFMTPERKDTLLEKKGYALIIL